jgi:hypothetical protein
MMGALSSSVLPQDPALNSKREIDFHADYRRRICQLEQKPA